MDEIEKFLKRLNRKELAGIKRVLLLIYKREWSNLDIKSLRGHKNIFRVRFQRFRIIFQEVEGKILVIFIDRRDDNTYNF